jgi:Flp pilus assembly protein TadG
MKKRTLAIEIWRDPAGASMVEFVVIMPVLFVLTLGTVDLGYLLYDYGVADKAAYVGAHRAIVSSPAASDITTINWTATDIGDDCSKSSGSSGFCSSYITSTTCIKPSTTGSCTNGHTYNDTAFTAIVGVMQRIYGCTAGSTTCALQPKNVSITYDRSSTLGFVGQPNGLPMNVTVSISCMYHTFYFIGGLMGWAFQPQQGCGGTAAGWAIPPYSTTLTSEDMITN